MADLVPCKDCGHQVSKRAKTCPSCGVRKPGVAPRKPATLGETLGGLVLMLAIAGGIYYWAYESPEEREARLIREAQQAEERRQAGFHCLSDWDGSHRVVVRYTRERLHDPGSFDHVSTRITPVDAEGNHELLMEYRANNAFGARTLGAVHARIRNSDCGATILAVE